MNASLTGHPACKRCGSHKLRRAHSLTGPQRLLRRFTTWDRYACGHCGYRGWSWGKVAVHHDEPLPTAAPAPSASAATPGEPRREPGRPLETRDHRLRRKVRARTVLVVATAVVLGVAVALLLQRCGGVPGE